MTEICLTICVCVLAAALVAVAFIVARNTPKRDTRFIGEIMANLVAMLNTGMLHERKIVAAPQYTPDATPPVTVPKPATENPFATLGPIDRVEGEQEMGVH